MKETSEFVVVTLTRSDALRLLRFIEETDGIEPDGHDPEGPEPSYEEWQRIVYGLRSAVPAPWTALTGG